MADQQIQNLINALQPQAFQPRQELRAAVYNTVFGQVQIRAPENAGEPVRVGLQAAALQNYVQRELGITTKLQKLDRMRSALLNPNAYIIAKEQDLIAIGDRCATRFSDVYTLSLQRGMSNEATEKAAKHAAEELYKSEMVIHKQNFPKDISETLYKKLSN